jgi:hypothetical protein
MVEWGLRLVFMTFMDWAIDVPQKKILFILYLFTFIFLIGPYKGPIKSTWKDREELEKTKIKKCDARK